MDAATRAAASADRAVRAFLAAAAHADDTTRAVVLFLVSKCARASADSLDASADVILADDDADAEDAAHRAEAAAAAAASAACAAAKRIG